MAQNQPNYILWCVPSVSHIVYVCVYVPMYVHSYHSASLFERICMLFYVEFNKKNRTEWATQQIHSPDVQNNVVPMSLGAQPKQTHTNTHTNLC